VSSLELSKIQTGLPVKSTKQEGIFEILRVDEFSETVWCNKLNSIDLEIKEFRAGELEEV
jgi:hypothetical protein